MLSNIPPEKEIVRQAPVSDKKTRGLPKLAVSGIIIKTTRLPSRESWYLPGNKIRDTLKKYFYKVRQKHLRNKRAQLKDEGYLLLRIERTREPPHMFFCSVFLHFHL
jgi:hypothetical protein